MACILCNSDKFITVVKIKEHTIVKCAQCTFVYTTPLPERDAIVKFYSEHIPEKFKPHKGLSRKFKYFFLVRRIKRYFPKGKTLRLLEIGCSQGRLLLSLQADEQFSATGIDLTDISVQYAKSLNLNVLKGTLESQSFANESFDVVVALQTIEHVLDPIRELAEINRVLTRGGIFIATVPCVTHVKARISGIKWKYYGPPGHLWYFSPKTFKLLLNKTGFEPVHVSCFSNKAYLKATAKKI